MTRNGDLSLDDPRECEHYLTEAVSENGEIVEWTCRCGWNQHPPEVVPAKGTEAGK